MGVNGAQHTVLGLELEGEGFEHRAHEGEADVDQVAK